MSTFTLHVNALRVVESRLMHLAEAVAVMARDEVVTTMDPGPARTGNTYLVPSTKVPYTASAPGEPPAVREGIYRDSWQFSPAVREGSSIRARAFTALRTEDGKYLLGELLEYGTRRPMRPRPHVRPAFESVQPAVAELVRRAAA